MPDLPIIQTRDANGIDHLFLNQPDRHNALSPDMIAALYAAFTKLGDDPSCRLVCLRATKASETSFCAGGDLVWMRQQIDAPRSRRMAPDKAYSAEGLLQGAAFEQMNKRIPEFFDKYVRDRESPRKSRTTRLE